MTKLSATGNLNKSQRLINENKQIDEKEPILIIFQRREATAHKIVSFHNHINQYQKMKLYTSTLLSLIVHKLAFSAVNAGKLQPSCTSFCISISLSSLVLTQKYAILICLFEYHRWSWRSISVYLYVILPRHSNLRLEHYCYRVLVHR